MKQLSFQKKIIGQYLVSAFIFLFGSTNFVFGQECENISLNLPENIIAGNKFNVTTNNSYQKTSVKITEANGNSYSVNLPTTIILNTVGGTTFEINSNENICEPRKNYAILVGKYAIQTIGESKLEIDSKLTSMLGSKGILIENINKTNKPTAYIATHKTLGGIEELSKTIIEISSGTKKTPIIITTSFSKNIVEKRLIATLPQNESYPILVMTNKELNDLLVQRLLQPEKISDSISNNYLIPSFKKNRWAIGSITDYLIFKGIPINFVSLILTTSFVIFFLVFIRQIIGINFFNISYPVFFALGANYIDSNFLRIVVVSSIIANILMNFINSNISLLFTAKKGLLYFVSVIVFFMVLTTFLYFDGRIFIDSNHVELIMIFWFFSIIQISSIFVTIQSKNRLGKTMSILAFLLIILFSQRIMTSSTLQSIILQYPIVLIIFGIGVVIIGKYTGLQLSEYFRFRKLIGKQRFKSSKPVVGNNKA